MVLYLISLLVFLGVGSGFVKSGLDVWLLVWDHFILFNIPLENTTMNVRLNIVLLQLTTLGENFRIFINSYDFLWVTIAQEFMSTQICYKVMKCLTCWNNKLPTKIMSQQASKILVIHKHSPPVTKFFHNKSINKEICHVTERNTKLVRFRTLVLPLVEWCRFLSISCLWLGQGPSAQCGTATPPCR